MVGTLDERNNDDSNNGPIEETVDSASVLQNRNVGHDSDGDETTTRCLGDAELEQKVLTIIQTLMATDQELIIVLSQHSITAGKMEDFTLLKKNSTSFSMEVARSLLRRGIWYDAASKKYLTNRVQRKTRVGGGEPMLFSYE
jgi:hypothetical protein